MEYKQIFQRYREQTYSRMGLLSFFIVGLFQIPTQISGQVNTLLGVAGILAFVLLILWITFLIRARKKKQLLQELSEVHEAETVPFSRPEPVTQEKFLEAIDLDATALDKPTTTPVSDERPADIPWQIAGLTDVGMKRQLNEDHLLMAEADLPELGPTGLYIVADGMGGHEGGEVASELTVQAVHQHFLEQSPTNPPFEEWLREAAMSANRTVIANQKVKDDEERKMGSTLVMALINQGKAYIANVGDSRAYRINQEIDQISIDHSLVERLIQIGQITREEARTHNQRNVIYSTIGDKEKMEIGLYHLDLRPEDRLLLCSDGLSGMIEDEEILAISQKYDSPAEACQEMIRAAKVAGGNDNITAILVQLDKAYDPDITQV